MRLPRKILILLLILLSACSFPVAARPAPGLTAVPATVTPSQEDASIDCAFAWARQSLPGLSGDFEKALQELQPEASGYAEAYGENCLNSQGEAVRFLPMETDFHVTVLVIDLDDKQSLGEWIEQVLEVVSGFPVEETPGPQPGYVGITFDAGEEETQLWFSQQVAQAALESGLRGEELFDALQAQ